MELRERLASKGPKRILALDGGGIRSLITLGYLESVERTLRERHQKPDLRLCDYFDLIGGTSTGAIIAAMLAVGMAVADVRKAFLKISKKMFRKRQWGVSNMLFKISPFENELKKIFKDVALGSPEIRTGLCIVAKRADTNASMLFINHHRDVHFNRFATVMLRKILCASAGVSGYFSPQLVELGPNDQYYFMDGGLGMNNNPSWRLFLTASIQNCPFKWPIGEERMMLVSIGAGFLNYDFPVDRKRQKKLLKKWIEKIPFMIMDEASRANQMILQHISRTPTPWEIDRDMGNLSMDLLTSEPALTYIRYDVRLDTENLKKFGIENADELIKTLLKMKLPKDRTPLLKIGEESAKFQIEPGHFPINFDLTEDSTAVQE